LTLSSNISFPVTTSDVTGATTIYFTPYKGNRIDLFDGTNWIRFTFSQLSLALGTLTSGLPYDVFVYNNAGTLTLEFTAWTNGTTRATALAYQNGVLCKTGALTRRYLGTFYTTSTTTTEDSIANRYLWNYYNRVIRKMKAVDATNSWTYSTATFRQANAAATNQLNFVIGYSEDSVEANVMATFSGSAGSIGGAVGIGLDSTTANSADLMGYRTTEGTGTDDFVVSHFNAPIAVGKHYLAWLEIAINGGTVTWLGDGNVSYLQSGIIGTILG